MNRSRTDWQRLREMTEDEIERNALSDPEAQPTDKSFWEGAEVYFPKPKQRVIIRLDQDVLAWFKSQGKGYQERINKALKEYKEAHNK